MDEKQYLLYFCKWLGLNRYEGNDLECHVESLLNHLHEEYTQAAAPAIDPEQTYHGHLGSCAMIQCLGRGIRHDTPDFPACNCGAGKLVIR